MSHRRPGSYCLTTHRRREHRRRISPSRVVQLELLEERCLLTGELGFLEQQIDEQNGVDGLNFTFATTTSPDGKHVYAVGGVSNVGGNDDNAIAVFSRDETTGALTFQQVLFDDDDTGDPGTADGLLSARDVKVSPDGLYVYTAGSGDDGIGIFSRNPTTGLLTYVSAVFDGGAINGLNGATSIAISPDGTSLYVAGRDDDAVAVFSRNLSTGALTFVEFEADTVGGVTGLDRILSVKVSPDGKFVYTAAGGNRNFTGADAIAVFARDSGTGALSFVSSYADGDTQGGNTIAGLDDLSDLVISPDGKYVYGAGNAFDVNNPDPWMAVFSRDEVTGELTWTTVINDFNPGCEFPSTSNPGESYYAMTPDGSHLYVTMGAQIVGFTRDAMTGALTFDSCFCGLDNLGHLFASFDKLSVDPSGRHIYVSNRATDSVIVLTTDLDFGDAPDGPYDTLRASDGARHVATGPTLGAARDIDLDGQSSVDAGATGTTGDDGDGGDDEDCLANPVTDLML
ncbi:MAG: beta-propeller fold lactonase family protein, partial [Planctomycetaceae bacterium]|nr:beta-propeller fold lactonase family protein [Planctomycetaceae bacterium]